VICGATTHGNINIIDPRIGLTPQNTVEGAHTGTIEDIDTQDNTLISCGWTFRYSLLPHDIVNTKTNGLRS
jgi:hypothetical protein